MFAEVAELEYPELFIPWCRVWVMAVTGDPKAKENWSLVSGPDKSYYAKQDAGFDTCHNLSKMVIAHVGEADADDDDDDEEE
jgi:hypothetical protein